MPPVCPIISHPYPPTTAEHVAHFEPSLSARERDPQDTQFQQLLYKWKKDNKTTAQTSARTPQRARARIHVGQGQVHVEGLSYFLVFLFFSFAA